MRAKRRLRYPSLPSGWRASPSSTRFPDDDYGGTNLFGRDLLPNLFAHAAAIELAEPGHALSFYRRHGYQVVGLLPDVNGRGKPDIVMAKRLAEQV